MSVWEGENEEGHSQISSLEKVVRPSRAIWEPLGGIRSHLEPFGANLEGLDKGKRGALVRLQQVEPGPGCPRKITPRWHHPYQG